MLFIKINERKILCLYDPWIPNHVFESLDDNFLVKKYYSYLQIGPIFFFPSSKIKSKNNFIFCFICGYKKG
jgi:hypothetical protein